MLRRSRVYLGVHYPLDVLAGAGIGMGYVSRMLDKLGLGNRTQAGPLAHDAGLVIR